MAIVWPVSLTQEPEATGFSQQLEDNLIRTQMDAGKAKVRRRFSAGVMLSSMSMVLTTEEKNTLVAFYETTLVDGSLEFDWIDHLKGGAATYRFVAPPIFRAIGQVIWKVTMQLEIVS